MNLEDIIKEIERLEVENIRLESELEKAKESEKYYFEEYNKLKREIEDFAEHNSKIYRYSTGKIAFVEATFTGIYTPFAVSMIDKRCEVLGKKSI